MSKVIRVFPAKREVIQDDPSIWCERCGYGATVGSIAAKEADYHPGKPCEWCGDPMVIETREYESYTPRTVEVRCDCDRMVICQGFTNPCYCGADYDSNGNRLAPREQWGEETGETYADIVGPSIPGEDLF